KEDTALELTVQGSGNKRTLSARLFDPDTPGPGIEGRTVYFYAGEEQIGTATTDSNGTATVGVPSGFRGAKQDFEARFQGDDYYQPFSDQTGSDSTS
ncbi:MAG: hypothetical protein ACRDI3_03150, partial [Actinomycetota bacterium]